MKTSLDLWHWLSVAPTAAELEPPEFRAARQATASEMLGTVAARVRRAFADFAAAQRVLRSEHHA